MRLRARIVLVVLVVLPICFLLIVIGITSEVLRAKDSMQVLRSQLMQDAAERFYAADLRSALESFGPEAGPMALSLQRHLLDGLVRRTDDENQPLRDWVIYWSDGELGIAGREVIPDDRAAREEAMATGQPVVRGSVVWQRVEFGKGPQARVVGVIGMQLAFEVDGFDLIGQMQLIFAISAIGTVALATVLLMLLGRSVVRPVNELAMAAEHVSQGDYSYRVPVSGRVDEISQFTSVFNEMVAHVQDYSQNLEAEVAKATEQIRSTEKRLAVAGRLAATGRLAAEIAHEINNPVGGMINATRTLRTMVEKGALEEEKAQVYLELILDGLGRVERTVKEVLLFARREVRAAPANLSEPIERAETFVRHKADGKGVDLEVLIEDGLPQVFGDTGELQQVVLNLLLNAIDATERGGRVTLTARIAHAGALILIADTGCGMKPEVQEHAFDPFYTTKPEGEGTGIGLAIVHNIITSHNGEITLESKEGVGTTFRIFLPAHEPAAGEPGVP